MFAVLELRHLAEIFQTVFKDNNFAKECRDLADEVDAAIQKNAIFEIENHGKIYAYEIDGFGGKILMDDANVPNLISIPYLGYKNYNDPIYQNTRKFLLSESNPYFLRGKFAEGISSPHTGFGKIWHLGIIMRAMTSQNNAEIKNCLSMLKKTHAETGFMHESFNPDNPKEYTRDWFAWANTILGEMILKIYNERKTLLMSEM